METTESQDIRQQSDVRETGEWIKGRREELKEHVLRMAPGRNVGIATDNLPGGRRFLADRVRNRETTD